jgi:5-hydroxyisourate hydrolase
MSPITTHVLDLASGRPAKGVAVTLSIQVAGARWDDLASALTDDDGRIGDLLSEGSPLVAGIYRLQFETHAYFLTQGVRAFHPSVVVHFLVDNPSGHFHVPLLLSPFGYSTYRGS